MKYLCGTCGKSDKLCECGKDETPRRARPIEPRASYAPEGWFIRDLSERPDMLAKWKRMAIATHNSVGYPLREDQRKFAAHIIRQVEDWTGTAIL